jgi:pimeloyl-ACP methyl ester carboxylesterase
MKIINDPISLFGKFNAKVLLSVTPEYPEFKRLKRVGAGRAEKRQVSFSMKTQYQTVDGVKVRYAQGGYKGGPVVLLLSPLPQSILCYDPIWKKLEKHFQLFALDMPGFGRSEGGLEFMSFEAQGRFLEKFISAMNLKQVHIVGPDVGMPAALHYAIQQTHEVASLILGDGPGILPTANGSIINKAVESKFWRMIFRVTGSQAFVEGAYQLGCVNYVPSTAEVADYVASYSGRIGTVTHWFATYPENLATLDPHLASLDLPVQIFWGDRDIFLLADNASRLHQRLKRSQLCVFENCGHFSYQDKADEFAEMILAWIKGGYQKA